ncbi:quaternary amine ABC transporter ATP-binding protein [Nakamurella aerolata]|uniref:Glycine betaine/L-proline ABC transporter ATP-binding protein n=1 Tax=Nakamurella aerolata TaxID=1656892 RepID=A0A849A769_9ACTN|nr:glycine betaine/L-proline ABC transporter ATP-binding protein [Nakamurella aerolata]NNG36814.1 glycine betaine/L-proline ABC transporter ATP-binding protein [Nakamurella aerolata]
MSKPAPNQPPDQAATPAASPAVRVQDVYKVFGRREGELVRRLKAGEDSEQLKGLGTAAVIDATFDVGAGEIFVVMGLSGSGKSTLIRTINGLWKPSAGKVFVGDADITSVSDSRLRSIRRDRISMVFQHFALLPHRTVRENAAYALKERGVGKAERLDRADHWLDVVGLKGWGDRYPNQLSGGMQQRVGLARALAAETDILLMDEAFSALDPLIRREMQDQLIELQSTLGKTIVFITHDLNEAMYVGDRVAVMRSGRIVQIGTAEQILTDPANDYVARFTAEVDRAKVLTAASVMEQPGAVVPLTSGPRGAVNEMRQHQTSGVLVVDRDRRLLGYVTDSDVVAAVKQGSTDLESLIRRDGLVTVQESTPVADMFAPAAESPVPLAVIGDNGRLRGVVPRVGLLASMAPPAGEPNPIGRPTPIEPSGAEPSEPATENQAGPAERAAAAESASISDPLTKPSRTGAEGEVS